MPDDENTPQESNTSDIPQNSESEAPTMPSEAPEASGNSSISESNKEAPQNDPEIRVESENEEKTLENQGNGNPEPEPQNSSVEKAEPVQTYKEQTAQVPPNEPLPASVERSSETREESKPESEKPDRYHSKPAFARELLVKARNAIQNRKRKKLDKIMTLFLKHSKITNDEVEKFLHVSDATTTRYLSQLEREGRIKQNGKTGKGVSYSKL